MLERVNLSVVDEGDEVDKADVVVEDVEDKVDEVVEDEGEVVSVGESQPEREAFKNRSNTFFKNFIH